jgi:CRP-like cAMP-binding protein
LASAASVRPFRRADVLAREHDPPEWVHIVERGFLRSGRTTTVGREVGFGLVGPGEVAGVLSVLDGGRLGEELRAVTGGLAIALSSREVRDVVERSPPLALAFGRLAAMQARRAREDLVERMTLEVATRLARRLVDLGSSLGVPVGTRASTMLPIGQQDLADLVGAARETVSKALSRFVTAGWITTSARRIVVMDHDALRAFAGIEQRFSTDGAPPAW